MQDKDHDSSDEEDRRANITAKLDLQVKSFLALGQAWPSDQCTQDDHYDRLITCLSSSLPNNHWKLQVAILSSIACVYDRCVELSFTTVISSYASSKITTAESVGVLFCSQCSYQ